MSTIFDRGVNNSTISNIIKICRELDISTDALADGEISPRSDILSSESEYRLIALFRSINEDGQTDVVKYTSLLCESDRYKKGEEHTKKSHQQEAM
jgi:hypothetical protein